MKNKAVLFGLAAVLITSATFAQGVENDDMYFNSKDRAKLKAKLAQDEATYQAAIAGKYNSGSKKTQKINDEYQNPTDTYSARNENPEFAARSNSQAATEDNQDYFVSDYRYKTSSMLNSWNNSYSNFYGNPGYTSNYYAPSIYGRNSAYYGSYYDAWGNPWMSPYSYSGWSSSLSFYGGNAWNYGWGNNFGMGLAYGSPFMNSWYGWGSSFGYGYGSPYGYYGGGYYGGYPGSVVIINNGEGGRNIAYGKRGTHSGMVVSRQDGNTNSRTRTSVSYPDSGVRPSGNVGGRMPASSTAAGRNHTQDDYYNRSWRSAQQSGGSYSAPSRGSWTSPGQSTGNDNWSRNSWNNSSNNGSSNTGRRT